jgi:hypothetical protein
MGEGLFPLILVLGCQLVPLLTGRWMMVHSMVMVAFSPPYGGARVAHALCTAPLLSLVRISYCSVMFLMSSSGYGARRTFRMSRTPGGGHRRRDVCDTRARRARLSHTGHFVGPTFRRRSRTPGGGHRRRDGTVPSPEPHARRWPHDSDKSTRPLDRVDTSIGPP